MPPPKQATEMLSKGVEVACSCWLCRFKWRGSVPGIVAVADEVASEVFLRGLKLRPSALLQSSHRVWLLLSTQTTWCRPQSPTRRLPELRRLLETFQPDLSTPSTQLRRCLSNTPQHSSEFSNPRERRGSGDRKRGARGRTVDSRFVHPCISHHL